MRFSIIAAATTLLSAVMAQQVYITAPVAATEWAAPGKVAPKWNFSIDPTSNTKALSVDLFKGDPTHQELVQNLGTAPAGSTTFAATLPALASGWYSVRIGESYSHYFLIKGTGAVPTNGPPTAAPTTAAPVATSTTNSLPSSTGNTTTATGTSTPLPTKNANAASFLSAAPAAMAIVAVAAAALAF